MQDSPLIAFLKAVIRHPVVLMIVAIIVVIMSQVATVAITRPLETMGVSSDLRHLIEGVCTAGLAILAYWLFVRFIERAPFNDFALPGAGREWGFGIALGLGAMAITIGIMATGGAYKVTGTNAITVLIPVIGMTFASGVIEEILLRGIIFRFLEQWLGSWAALALSAVLFGALHLGNDNATYLAGAAIALEAGVMLAAIYMLTRRLWAAIGMHMAWNFAQGGIFGVAVSGNDFTGLLRNRVVGPEWLTGGAFGAESSLPAVAICTMIGLWVILRAAKAGQFIKPSWQRFKYGRVAAS